MATGGQFYWPSVGNFVAAYGQFFMAANKCHCFWAPTLAALITADHHKINADVNPWG